MSKRGAWHWSCVVMMGFLGLCVLQAGSQVATASFRASPTPVAIATVDLARLLEMLDEKLAREGELQAFVTEQQAKIDAAVKRVEDAEGDLGVATPQQQEAFSIKYLEAASDAKLAKDIGERLIARKQRQFQLELFNKIKAASADYAKAEGYSLVFCDDSAMEIPAGLNDAALHSAILSQRLVYVQQEAVDITEAVAVQMNAAFVR